MHIGEFSSRSGVSIDTLRYYEKIGLLRPKRHNRQRIYQESDLKLLHAIKKLKQMSFSLEDIRKILHYDRKIDEGLLRNCLPREIIAEGLSMFRSKLLEIEKKEKELKEVKLLLQHILDKITSIEAVADEGYLKGE